MKLEELKKEWEMDHRRRKKYSNYCLDQIELLSVYEIEQDFAMFYRINPLDMNKIQKVRYDISNAPGWVIDYLEKTGLAFRIEGKTVIAAPELLMSFRDLFGMTGSSLRNCLWRDQLIANLFREEGFANLTIMTKDKFRVLQAIHYSDIEPEVGLYSVVEHLVRKNGYVLNGYNKTDLRWQIELLLPETTSGWRKALICRDSEIGRESLTFYIAWRNGESLVYVSEIKYRHRSNPGLEKICSQVEAALADARLKLPVCTVNMAVDKVKGILGKKRTDQLKLYLCSTKLSKDPSEIITAVSEFANSQLNDRELITCRLKMGELVKC